LLQYGLASSIRPSLVPGREGVLGHHPANRGVPKCTHSRVKKSVSELVDHTFYILDSNPPFLQFQRAKSIRCGLHLRLWDGFWKNDSAAVRAVRTIQ
jgi:hypothetical protein